MNQMTSSNCGWRCGYLIEKKSFLNPIDTLFVYSSYYFPLDYLLFFIFTTYIFICTLYGIIKCGINFLFIKVPFSILLIVYEGNRNQKRGNATFIINNYGFHIEYQHIGGLQSINDFVSLVCNFWKSALCGYQVKIRRTMHT